MKDSPYINEQIYNKLKLLNFGFHIPTYTEVFDWIYKKHNLFISIEAFGKDGNDVIFSTYTTELENMEIVLGDRIGNSTDYKESRDKIYLDTLNYILSSKN